MKMMMKTTNNRDGGRPPALFDREKSSTQGSVSPGQVKWPPSTMVRSIDDT